MKYFYLGYRRKLFIKTLVLSLFLILSIACFRNSYKSVDEVAISNKVISSLNYKVHIIDNDFYKNEFLDENGFYISSLIDKIDINFNYSEIYPKNYDNYYDYKAVATLKMFASSAELYKEDFILDSNIESKNTDNVLINKNISIDYNHYKNIVDQFKSANSISVSGQLEVNFYLNSSSDDFNENINSSITIPLTNQYFNISKKESNPNNQTKIIQKQDIVLSNKPLLLLGFVFALLYYIVVCNQILYLFNTHKKLSDYEKLLKKYLRQYDRLIINLKGPIDISNYKIIDVSQFKELIDMRDNLEKPILFYELHKKQKALFFILSDDKIAYRFILKNIDVGGNND